MKKEVTKKMIRSCLHLQSLRAMKSWSGDTRTVSFGYNNPEIRRGTVR
jgi:hypothetical protein